VRPTLRLLAELMPLFAEAVSVVKVPRGAPGVKPSRTAVKSAKKTIGNNTKSTAAEVYKYKTKTERLVVPLRNERYFETSVGHFWGLLDPRDYCRARCQWGIFFRKLGEESWSYLALDLANEHFMDLIWLSSGDNQGLRSLIPSLLISLDRVQESYDFIKWWCTCDPDGTYDWGDTSLPYLDCKDEDITEPLSCLSLSKYTETQHLVDLALIKCIPLSPYNNN